MRAYRRPIRYIPTYNHDERQETGAHIAHTKHWEKMTNYLFISCIKINDGNFSQCRFLNRRKNETNLNEENEESMRETYRVRQLIFLFRSCWIVRCVVFASISRSCSRSRLFEMNNLWWLIDLMVPSNEISLAIILAASAAQFRMASVNDAWI